MGKSNIVIETVFILFYILIYIFISDRIMNGFWRLIKGNGCGNNKFLSIFYNTLIFSTILVTITAIICTHVRSIFLMCVPFLIWMFISFKKDKCDSQRNENAENRTHIVWISISIITLFTIVASYYIPLKFAICSDVSQYTKIGECLVEQGLENPYQYFNYESKAYSGNMAYHYFEMWFGGLLFKLNQWTHFANCSNFILFNYISYNLFRVLILLGLFGLANKYLKFNLTFFIICTSLFLMDISVFFNWGNNAYVAESNYFERPNFIYYYLFLIPIVDAVLNNKLDRLIIWCCIFMISNITALPAIGGSLFFYLIFIFFTNKQIRIKALILGMICVCFVIAIGLFYSLFGTSEKVSMIGNFGVKDMINKTASIWKACVYMFVILCFKVVLVAAFIFGISKLSLFKSINISKEINRAIFYLLLLNITGIGLFQLIPYIDNSYQFAFIGYCLLMLMLILVITLFINNSTNPFKIALSAVCLLIVVFGIKRNVYNDELAVKSVNWRIPIAKNFLLQYELSENYADAIKTFSEIRSLNKGASIIDSADVMVQYSGLRHSAIYQVGFYEMVYRNSVHLPLISDPQTLYPDKDTLNKDYYKPKQFNQHTSFYENYNIQISYKQNLNRFIKDHQIDHLYVSKSFEPLNYFSNTEILSIVMDDHYGHKLILVDLL